MSGGLSGLSLVLNLLLRNLDDLLLRLDPHFLRDLLGLGESLLGLLEDLLDLSSISNSLAILVAHFVNNLLLDSGSLLSLSLDQLSMSLLESLVLLSLDGLSIQLGLGLHLLSDLLSHCSLLSQDLLVLLQQSLISLQLHSGAVKILLQTVDHLGVFLDSLDQLHVLLVHHSLQLFVSHLSFSLLNKFSLSMGGETVIVGVDGDSLSEGHGAHEESDSN
jgi:hypothetical protein